MSRMMFFFGLVGQVLAGINRSVNGGAGSPALVSGT